MEIGMIFTGTYFTGRIEVLGIDEANNKLRVALTKPLREGEKDSGFSNWNEDWDLQHTKWGFDRGEYFIKNFLDYPPTYFGDTKEPCNIYDVVLQSEQLPPQICYKTNEPCKYNCSGLCKESC